MATKYAILGTAMNWSASTWGTLNTGATWNTGTKTLTGAAHSEATNTLAGKYIEIGQTLTSASVLCTIASNEPSTSTIVCNEAGPASGTGTVRWILFNQAAPGNGDTANLNGAVVTMDIATVPASGTLAEIQSKASTTAALNSAGQLALALAANSAINATNINGGSLNTQVGFVEVTGTDATKTLTITGNVTAGNQAHSGVRNNSTGTVAIVSGNVSGGTGLLAFGANNASTGKITISNGTITAGTASALTNQPFAVDNKSTGALEIENCNIVGGDTYGNTGIRNMGGGTCKFTNCNLINGTSGVAYYGIIPTWVNDNSNYLQWSTRTTAGGEDSAKKFGVEPTAGQLLSGVVCGDVTGNYVEVAEADVESGVTYGASSAKTGTFAVPAVTDVEKGVTYGAAAEFTGTFKRPLVADVRSGSQYGAADTEFTGTCAVPAAADVEFGVNVDNTTGLFVVPTEAQVENGVDFGAAAEFTGTFVGGGAADYPAESDVRHGTTFDTGAKTGTAHIPAAANVRFGTAVDATTGTCRVPVAADVEFGVAVDNTTGTFVAPAVGDVEKGVTFGAAAEFTGTFKKPAVGDVRLGTQYGAGDTEFTGTLLVTGGSAPDGPPDQLCEWTDGVCSDPGGGGGGVSISLEVTSISLQDVA